MNVELECTYCGHKWDKTVYNKSSIESEKCPHCADTNLKVRDANVAKIDAYKGCPPFPPKKGEPDWSFKTDKYIGVDFAFAGADDAMDAIRTQLLRSMAVPPGDF